MLEFSYWTPVLIAAGYAAIITLGQYVSMSSGILSVAAAALAGIGGYVAGLVSVDTALPLVVGLLLGMAGAAGVGLVIGYLTVRLAPLVAGLMTLAFAEVLVVVALNLKVVGAATGLGGISLETDLPLVALILAVVVLIVWRYDKSRLGLAATACRDDARAAAAAGVNVAWVKTLTFSLGGAISGLGGAVAVHWTLVQTPSDLGFYFGTNFLAFAVLGGSYSVWGAAAGAISLTILPEVLRFSSSDRYIIYGVLLTAVVIHRPDGLFRRRALRPGRQKRFKNSPQNPGYAFEFATERTKGPLV